MYKVFVFIHIFNNLNKFILKDNSKNLLCDICTHINNAMNIIRKRKRPNKRDLNCRKIKIVLTCET